MRILTRFCPFLFDCPGCGTFGVSYYWFQLLGFEQYRACTGEKRQILLGTPNTSWRYKLFSRRDVLPERVERHDKESWEAEHLIQMVQHLLFRNRCQWTTCGDDI